MQTEGQKMGVGRVGEKVEGDQVIEERTKEKEKT